MFRVSVYGLWSRDFMSSLSRVLAELFDTSLEAARAKVEQVTSGEVITWENLNMKKAVLLAEGLMEYGAYVGVEQTGPLSEEQYTAEIIEDLSPDLTGWVVVLDKTEEHVQKIIDPKYLVKLRFGNERMQDRIGEALMWRGAAPISKIVEEDLEAKMKAWREAWGQRIRAAIARKIALRKKEEE